MMAGLCFLICISGQSVPLGLLAASTLRMKCFWSPYICILASAAISDPSIWSAIVAKVNSFFRRWKNKYFFRSGVRSAQQEGDELHKAPHPPLCHPPSCKPSEAHHRQGNGGKQQESQSLKFKTSCVPPQDLREFYDPDTVDLMQWIDQNSEPDDAFSGSMQLLAGVKLCTGRTLTNHPHFEDKALRDRTKELYQMYAKVGVAGQEVVQNVFLQSGQPIGRPHKPEEIQRILCDP